MTDLPPLPPSPMFQPLQPPPPPTRARSMGLKLLVVCALALVMMLPAVYVSSLVEERANRSRDVAHDVSQHEGGEQTFLGPVLVVPFSVQLDDKSHTIQTSAFMVFPTQADAAFKVSTEERRRSLFKVPVFRTDATFEADFNLHDLEANKPAGATFDLPHAELVLGVSDARGALADATASVGGKSVTLAPARITSTLGLGGEGQSSAVTLFGTPAALTPDAAFHVSASMRFSGAQRMAVLAYGKSTHVTVDSDWKSPGFDGGFLPTSHTIADKGFHAEWSVPFLARGVRAMGPIEEVKGLSGTELGVNFVEVADPYQSVSRALKYAALFIGLVFLAYFVFEVTAGKRVHPAQYVLVGLAQTIFYLLLLSVAERLGFDLAFLLGGAATVILLSANAGWVFESRAQSFRALGIFSLLYGLIYVMLRLEDNALLVGAVASFVAIAAAMYLTRRVDWYSSWNDATSGFGARRQESRTSLFPGGVL